MPEQDRTGVPGHELPPPRPMFAAIAAVGFNLAALIAILLDYCDAALILIILAILFGGFVVKRISSPSDKQPVDGHELPPP